jgi:hypothetical protein
VCAAARSPTAHERADSVRPLRAARSHFCAPRNGHGFAFVEHASSRMPKAAYETLQGRYVRFRVDDIYLPEPVSVLAQLHAGEILQGKVIDLSDSEPPGGVFVVIEVDGLDKPCILSVDRILRGC